MDCKHMSMTPGILQAPPRAPYADDPPREITDEDLSFLSEYTGERDLAVLRTHVLKVWAAVKAKVRCDVLPKNFPLQPAPQSRVSWSLISLCWYVVSKGCAELWQQKAWSADVMDLQE